MRVQKSSDGHLSFTSHDAAPAVNIIHISYQQRYMQIISVMKQEDQLISVISLFSHGNGKITSVEALRIAAALLC